MKIFKCKKLNIENLLFTMVKSGFSLNKDYYYFLNTLGTELKLFLFTACKSRFSCSKSWSRITERVDRYAKSCAGLSSWILQASSEWLTQRENTFARPWVSFFYFFFLGFSFPILRAKIGGEAVYVSKYGKKLLVLISGILITFYLPLWKIERRKVLSS